MGISTKIYHGKQIYIVDFSNYGESKEDTVKLITQMSDEFVKNPLNSVLALINVTDVFFCFDTFKGFKKFDKKCRPYEKKSAVIGLNGMKKTGFNSIVGKSSTIKVFDSELEAMEWLISD
jgi:hypothetical protein